MDRKHMQSCKPLKIATSRSKINIFFFLEFSELRWLSSMTIYSSRSLHFNPSSLQALVRLASIWRHTPFSALFESRFKLGIFIYREFLNNRCACSTLVTCPGPLYLGTVLTSGGEPTPFPFSRLVLLHPLVTIHPLCGSPCSIDV